MCYCIVIRGQAEKEFKVEVEAIGKVRHKNLVRLVGYCAEGARRYCSVHMVVIVLIQCHSEDKSSEFLSSVTILLSFRMLVYEYVDNGNLEQWLHGDVGPVSPLTWDIRMRIAIGTAKGCV